MRIAEAVSYLREVRLAVVATVGVDGAAQAAVVGIGATDALEIVFDTIEGSRKHANLLRDPRTAVTAFGSGERTLQVQGCAVAVPLGGAVGEPVREAYYLSWPDGRERLTWPGLRYWCVRPDWARFTDYTRSPPVVQLIG